MRELFEKIFFHSVALTFSDLGAAWKSLAIRCLSSVTVHGFLLLRKRKWRARIKAKGNVWRIGAKERRGKKKRGGKSRASCEILDCRVLLALPSDPTRSFRPFKPLNCRQTTVSTNAELCTLLSCMGCLVSIFQFHCDWNWIEKRDTSLCELYYVYFAFRKEGR